MVQGFNISSLTLNVRFCYSVGDEKVWYFCDMLKGNREVQIISYKQILCQVKGFNLVSYRQDKLQKLPMEI